MAATREHERRGRSAGRGLPAIAAAILAIASASILTAAWDQMWAGAGALALAFAAAILAGLAFARREPPSRVASDGRATLGILEAVEKRLLDAERRLAGIERTGGAGLRNTVSELT